MALNRLGKHDKALEWYEKGNACSTQHGKWDPDVEACRAEAAAVLGIGKAKG
jgi:hypothetical protein